MSAHPRQRTPAATGLSALVDEALSSLALGRAAHAEDWPEQPMPSSWPVSPALPRAVWDRALGDVARDILGRPSRQFRARMCELGWRLADGAGEVPAASPGADRDHARGQPDRRRHRGRLDASPGRPCRAPGPRRPAHAQRRDLDVLLGPGAGRAAAAAARHARRASGTPWRRRSTAAIWGSRSISPCRSDARRARSSIAPSPPARC